MNSTSNLLYNLSNYDRRDYRRYLFAHLQYLNGLCELSVRTVNNSINEFLSSSYVTTQLATQIEFDEKLSERIQQMQSSFSKTIMNLLFLTENINHGNAFISTYGTNYEYVLSWSIDNNPYLATESVVYDNNCSCQLYSNCTSQASFLSTNSSEIIPLKGLKIGCLPSQSFLLSTLECFYDQSCINLIEENIHSTSSMSSSLIKTSRFLLNTTINELIKNVFIEQLKTTINYSRYYERCSPSMCSYTYIEHIDLVYTITFLIGLQGGLSIVLKWLSPKLVRIFYSIYRYRKRRIHVVEIVNPTIDLSSVPTVRYRFLSIKSFCTCLTIICLSITVILFSIYINTNEKKTTIASKTLVFY